MADRMRVTSLMKLKITAREMSGKNVHPVELLRQADVGGSNFPAPSFPSVTYSCADCIERLPVRALFPLEDAAHETALAAHRRLPGGSGAGGLQPGHGRSVGPSGRH